MVRRLWDERAAGAVLAMEFLEVTRVGCRTPTRAVIGLREEEGQEPEGAEGGPNPP